MNSKIKLLFFELKQYSSKNITKKLGIDARIMKTKPSLNPECLTEAIAG